MDNTEQVLKLSAARDRGTLVAVMRPPNDDSKQSSEEPVAWWLPAPDAPPPPPPFEDPKEELEATTPTAKPTTSPGQYM